MSTVLIGMGSNINPIEHLSNAANQIRAAFPSVKYSQVYRSKAIGMDGDDFLNACCLLTGVKEKESLLVWLKGLEDKHKRDRSKGSWKPRTLDLDILIYDEEVIDKQAFNYAHVFVPASELLSLNLSKNNASNVRLIPLCL